MWKKCSVPPTMLRSVCAVCLTGCHKPQVKLLFRWFTSDHHFTHWLPTTAHSRYVWQKRPWSNAFGPKDLRIKDRKWGAARHAQVSPFVCDASLPHCLNVITSVYVLKFNCSSTQTLCSYWCLLICLLAAPSLSVWWKTCAANTRTTTEMLNWMSWVYVGMACQISAGADF